MNIREGIKKGWSATQANYLPLLPSGPDGVGH